MTNGRSSNVYTKRAKTRKDERQAFWNMYNAYLGQDYVDNMATQAKQKLTNLQYTGKLCCFNFNKYIMAHVSQHLILWNLMKHGHARIDEQSKVGHLNDGIKTHKIDSVKTWIYSDTTLRDNFDACVGLLRDFIKQSGEKGG